jgi:hypothetical protein
MVGRQPVLIPVSGTVIGDGKTLDIQAGIRKSSRRPRGRIEIGGEWSLAVIAIDDRHIQVIVP